ncbi:hypothetical protein L1857_28395 [Amycolatopsis thermalba]|uniref:Flagellar biosynthetic protein FliP n=1 Tax=Amycolatopsis thermalba TaxID=944492 RepID=A0ABY4P2J7_9PSEU|nr:MULTISPECIES: hypothetical protein [Amycolatopsis]UQS26453.1 hypothetical protein L1857_28395 [Amycolatopsis thermalba]
MTTLSLRSATTRRAVLHYVEMWIAMGLGMAVLGPLVRLGFDAAGWSAVLDRTDWRAMIMATEMALPMAAWMRVRRHGWGSVAEMTAWMYVPFAVLLVPYWAGVISGGALMGIGHGLMGLAMAVVVYRHRHDH